MRTVSPAFLVALMLALGAPVVHASEPNAVLGAGSGITCKAFAQMSKDPQSQPVTDMVFSWVQGYFTARNIADPKHMLTVGGTMSAATLQSMLVDQCRDPIIQKYQIVIAAQELYEKLQAKGL